MAVQWDSEKGFNGVAVDVFDAVKNKILGIKKEIPELGEMTKDALGWLQEGLSKDELKEFFNDETILKNIGETKESFMSFIDDVDLSGDVFAQYQQHLQKNTQSMTLFQRAGKAAGNAMKSLLASIGSMAAMWAIGEVISLIVKPTYEFYISTKTLNDLCQILQYDICDIVQYVPSDTDQPL